MGSGRSVAAKFGEWATAIAPTITPRGLGPGTSTKGPCTPCIPCRCHPTTTKTGHRPMENETVRKIHQLYDEREQVWFDVYEAPGVEGRPITAEVPREDQHPNAVRRHLLRKG